MTYKWKKAPNYLSLPEREDNFTHAHFHRWWKVQILTTDISQYARPCFSAHCSACFCSTTRRPTRSVLFPTKTPTEKNNKQNTNKTNKHETKEKQQPRNANLLAINAEKVGGVENSLQLPRKVSTKKIYLCLICFAIKANKLEEVMPSPGLKYICYATSQRKQLLSYKRGADKNLTHFLPGMCLPTAWALSFSNHLAQLLKDCSLVTSYTRHRTLGCSHCTARKEHCQL